jgi:glutamine synthetase
MAGYVDEGGSACHLNLALRGMRGNYALAERNGAEGLSEVGRAFIAGILEHATEVFLLYAPNINSYRRLGADRFTPSAVNWGHDNRTCALRVVGNEAALRIENRMPGSGADPV